MAGQYDKELIRGLIWTFMSGLAQKIHQGLDKETLKREFKIFINSMNNHLLKD